MNALESKTQNNRSHRTAENQSIRSSNKKPTLTFTDNRPESVTQRRISEMANNSKQILTAVQLKAVANQTVQRQELEEEEPVQGKFNTLQRQELEEEEPLQGKFHPF